MRCTLYRTFRNPLWTIPTLLALIIGGITAWNTALSPVAAASLTQPASLRFAVIGDYGTAGNTLASVANMIHGWNPDLVITTGDNNYGANTATGIDRNIGQYFNRYMYPYPGAFAGGATVAPNRFFPALGNHDMDGISCTGSSCSGAYLDYFTLPGNERYYDFVQGPVHFFMVNSDVREPDGNSATSLQANWLRQRLAASTARWKVVIVHHAPYTSSDPNGPEPALRWPYAAWGASIVLSGHDHNYERLLVDGFPYIVNGAGGTSLYPFGTPAAGSIVRYNADYGAMLVEADAATINFRFYNRSQQVIDSYTLPEGGVAPTPRSGGIFDRQISQSSDDVEEVLGTGRMVHTSTDLEMNDDSLENGLQSVGLRFTAVEIPQGALIRSAYLEFVVDEVDTVATSLQLRSHALDNSQPFTLNNFDLTSRPQSTAVVNWRDIAPWSTIGALQRTPDLSTILQEVVNRSGWQAGNALSLIITGSGHRTAVAFNGGSNNAPRLHITWDPAAAATATPIATATPNATATTNATATPIATATPNATATAIATATPNVTATPISPLPTPIAAALCAAKGNVVRELWNNVGGSALDDLFNSAAYPDQPDQTSRLSSLEAPINSSDNYATRIRGYLCPPVSGAYTFWIASDDNSQLYLSPDEFEQHKQPIASVTVWTTPRQWNRYAQQQSGSILLVAGHAYYFEVIHKEGEGWDNLAVAWRGPGIEQQVIAGSYLAPYQAKGATGTVETIIAQGMDDIEQSLVKGSIYFNSYDLDLGYDKRHEKDAQLVGLRFQKLRIPPKAMITNAYIEFTVAEADASSGASYSISAHAVDNAPPFYSDRFSLQSLPRTGVVKWNAAAWRRVGERQRTGNLKTIVQEIVRRAGWRSGNAMVFVLDSATGRRIAYSSNGNPAKAPRLHVEWTLGVDLTARSTGEMDELVVRPNLAVDYEAGAPGTPFHLSGENFPAQSTVTVLVNGNAEGTAQVDATGTFEFDIQTTGKTDGTITVATDIDTAGETSFVLDSLLPAYVPQAADEDEEETVTKQSLFLPLISR